MRRLTLLAQVLVFFVGSTGCVLRMPVVTLDEPASSPEVLNEERERGRWPQSPDELQVSLSVIHALEEGPVVCQVTLKNVSHDCLRFATDIFRDEAYCRLDCAGEVRVPPPDRMRGICGSVGPWVTVLEPGDTAARTFYLHGSFRSLPSGPATVHFGWRVFRVVPCTAEGWGLLKTLDLLFELQASQAVEVLPATDDNLTAMINQLEAMYAGIVQATEGKDNEDRYSPEVEDFVETLDMCRRKEFVPLLLRAAERIPSAWARHRLVATVYECFDSPDEAFAALSVLLNSPIPDAAFTVVSFWAEHDFAHEAARLRREAERAPREELGTKDPETQQHLRELDLEREKLWRSSHRHPDWRLTEKQFEQLLENTNVWVRVLLYSHYPDRCPAHWVENLFQDFERMARVPEGLEFLLTQLDDDDYLVRERATDKLIESGTAFAAHLWAIRPEEMTPEAANRLTKVLATVEKPKIPSLCRRTISHIIWDDKPHERRMVEILITSPRPSLIGVMARKRWEEEQESKERFRRTMSQKEMEGEKK